MYLYTGTILDKMLKSDSQKRHNLSHTVTVFFSTGEMCLIQEHINIMCLESSIHVSDILNKLIIPLFWAFKRPMDNVFLCLTMFWKDRSEQKHPDWNETWLFVYIALIFTCLMAYFSSSISVVVDVYIKTVDWTAENMMKSKHEAHKKNLNRYVLNARDSHLSKSPIDTSN